MNRRGRPPTPKDELLRCAKMVQRMVDEELAVVPLRKVAVDRAARRLKVSERTVKRRLSILKRTNSWRDLHHTLVDVRALWDSIPERFDRRKPIGPVVKRRLAMDARFREVLDRMLARSKAEGS